MKQMKILTLFALVLMIVGTFSVVPAVPVTSENALEAADQVGTEGATPEAVSPLRENEIARVLEDISPGVDPTDDVGLVLQDGANNYRVTYEPWKTKAAVHALAYDEDTGFLAVGGGYLYDNEIHIFRYNPETGNFDKVWDSGDGIIQGDILSLAWGDTDLNDFLEVVAASSDGRVHVFEQRHLYDPYANTENMFDHVWSSPYTFRAFAVRIDDVDRDYRPDIVVGSWDGKVRCFEYDNHSGYPFSPEHWITYREVWNSGDVIDGRIYTIATGDTNNNGLPDIVAGTREGRVYVFENDGVTMTINGEPFPLINDNHYRLVWTSENYTWTPIMDMEVGELDNTPGDEIALVAQGQGVFVLDWDEASETYTYEKVYRPWEAWQAESDSPWRLDFWADSVVTANNVSYQFGNGTLYPEPISYQYVGGGVFYPDAECYPFNTGMANETDGYYSVFDSSIANVDNATAVIDFGKDEEGTGSAGPDWDLDITLRDPVTASVRSEMNISVSQSGTDFEQVDPGRYSFIGNHLYVDVDDALGRRKWDWFRYIRISVYNGGVYYIDSIELAQVYTQITTALTVTIGPLSESFGLNGPPDQSNKLIVATVTGNILAFKYGGSYDLVWDSGRDDFFTVGTNVWDMIPVQAGGSRLPVWLYPGSYTPIANSSYFYWSVGDVVTNDWVGGTNPWNVLTVNSTGGITVYSAVGGSLEVDSDLTADFSAIDTMTGYDIVSVEMFSQLVEPYNGPEAPYAVVSYLSNDIASGGDYDTAGGMNGYLSFYHRPDYSSPYVAYYKPEAIDATGDIVDALSKAKAGPYVQFVDWDGDLDNDMILSTGFVYYCENIGPTETGRPQFRLHPGYFEEVNSREMNYFWGQPSVGDFDNDGDIDLVLSYDGRDGFTYWENVGDVNNPHWVENKRLFVNSDPETSFRVYKISQGRVVPLGHGLPWDSYVYTFDYVGWSTFTQAEYVFVAYTSVASNLLTFWPSYNQSNSYLLATYPEVRRYDFSIAKNANVWNFGYHVTESWSTRDELNGWTLTVSSGDVDGDGKGELIVGDYDNNLYVFEHMLNNTYKRAFRSFDVNYTVRSTTSPYYWEKLEGISGNFSRVIWNHVDELLADVDLDSDGKKEIVAAAGMQLYVFEDTGIDDTYRLVYTIDFRNSQFNTTVGWSYVPRITALGAGNDFDYNDMRELIVALGPYLFVFNVPYNNWDAAADYFMGGSMDGLFYLVGNGAQEKFKAARIDAIVAGDTDEDGYREVIFGGLFNVTQSRKDGFLKIYEWKGFSFEEVWSPPHEYVYWNPVTALMIDDQDYDSYQEIIVGHGKGFDVWEWNGTDSGYTNAEIVTSSPNHPYIDAGPARAGEENTTLYALRGQNDLAYLDTNHDFIMDVFVDGSTGSPRLFWRLYGVSADAWSGTAQVTPNTYPQHQTWTVIAEMDPALYFAPNGTLYLAWRAELWTGSSNVYYFYMMRYYDSTGWDRANMIEITTASTRRMPKPYLLGDGTLGIVYLSTTGKRPYYGYTSSWSGTWNIGGIAVNYRDYTDYAVTSIDLEALNDGGWALAISANNASVAKTDLDIFVVTTNSSFIWTDRPLHQVTTSYFDEVFPDLGVLDSPEDTLMVVYEVPAAPVEDRLQMAYSNDLLVWHEGHQMPSLPNYVQRVDNPDGTVTYLHPWAQPSPAPLYVPSAYSPAIVGMVGGGFIYVYVFDYSIRTIYDLAGPQGRLLDVSNPYYTGKLYKEHADLIYGINPSSRFVHYNIGGVTSMDAGDTDNDGRREVAAGFDDRVGVYELQNSNFGGALMRHREAWVSSPFPYDVTGVTVYDTNGNGYEEIGVSCERGEVFIFEVDDSSLPPVELAFSEQVWATHDAGAVPYSSLRYVIPYDIDSDGEDEVIVGSTNGTIAAFDGAGGSILWSYPGPGSGVHEMYLANTSDGLRLGVSHSDGNYTYLDATNGTLLWRRVFTGITFMFHWAGNVYVADVAPSPGPEVIATNSNSTVKVWAANGTVLWSRFLGGGLLSAPRIAAGNFSGRPELDLALVDLNGTVTFLYGSNGTVILHLEETVGSTYVNPLVLDYNGDGYDDLITYRDRFVIVDPRTGDLLYNSTQTLPAGELPYFLYAGDYDDDSQLEAMLVTNKAVHYEEFASGREVWTYAPLAGVIRGSYEGSFTDGRLGLALALDSGGLVALDALTGRVLWFDIENQNYNAAAAADVDGDGMDEIVGSIDNGTLYVVRMLEAGADTRPTPYTSWGLYWSQNYATDVDGVWAQDLDGDSVDELIVSEGEYLWAYSTQTMSVLWNLSQWAHVEQVTFGDLNGDSVLDILALGRSDPPSFTRVFGIDGATGHIISSIDHLFGTEAAGVMTGDFIHGVLGDEYVVVFSTSAPLTYAVCYSNGVQQAVTDVNISASLVDFEVGEFDGLTGLDFVLAAGTSVYMFSGSCVRQHYYLTGPTLTDIAVGDFDENGVDDVVAATGATVRTINASATGQNFWLQVMTGAITSVATGQWESGVSADGVAVAVEGEGVHFGRGSTQTWVALWSAGSYVGPMSVRAIATGNHDSAVISAGNTLVIWDPDAATTTMYHSAPGFVEGFVAAEFDSEPAWDVAYFEGSLVGVVTNGTQPAAGGTFLATAESDFSAFGLTVAVSVGGTPLLVGLAALALRRRRRRTTGK